MSATITSIYNRALSAIGSRDVVADPSEMSREAEVCNQWYDHVRDLCFSAAPWPRVKKYARLALLSGRNDDESWIVSDPEPGYGFAYAMPSDLVRPRYMSNYSRFVEGNVNGVSALMSTTEDAILFYTYREENPARWGIDLEDAIVFALAAHITMGLTGQKQKLQMNYQLAEAKIMAARVNAANQDNFLPETTPEWLAARGSAYTSPVSRFIHPNADFSVAGMGNVT